MILDYILLKVITMIYSDRVVVQSVTMYVFDQISLQMITLIFLIATIFNLIAMKQINIYCNANR